MIININKFKQYINENSLKDTHEIEEVHISTIKQGDTVLHNDEVKTVTGKDITFNSMTKDGKSIFGDSYNGGTKLVKKFII